MTEQTRNDLVVTARELHEAADKLWNELQDVQSLEADLKKRWGDAQNRSARTLQLLQTLGIQVTIQGPRAGLTAASIEAFED